jgi:hypothetical protein
VRPALSPAALRAAAATVPVLRPPLPASARGSPRRTSLRRRTTSRRTACRCPRTATSSAAAAWRPRARPSATPSCSRPSGEGPRSHPATRLHTRLARRRSAGRGTKSSLHKGGRDTACEGQPGPQARRTRFARCHGRERHPLVGPPRCREARASGGLLSQHAWVVGCKRVACPARSLAYDGKGNALVRTEADIDSAVAALGGYEAGLYAEKFAPFVKELAVMVVRRCARGAGRDGWPGGNASQRVTDVPWGWGAGLAAAPMCRGRRARIAPRLLVLLVLVLLLTTRTPRIAPRLLAPQPRRKRGVVPRGGDHPQELHLPRHRGARGRAGERAGWQLGRGRAFVGAGGIGSIS